MKSCLLPRSLFRWASGAFDPSGYLRASPAALLHLVATAALAAPLIGWKLKDPVRNRCTILLAAHLASTCSVVCRVAGTRDSSRRGRIVLLLL